MIFNPAFCNDSGLVIVNSIGSMLVGGVPMRVFSLTSLGPAWASEWIEGMGALNGFFFSGNCMVGFIEELVCFHNSGLLKYVNPNYGSCFFNYTGISEQVKNSIIISPNPATTSITLQIPQLESDAEVCVFNSLGEQVIKLKFCKAVTSDGLRVTSEVRIDVAHLPAGLYFVKMNNYSGKFVKQN
jgi:hypothetical protein